MNSFQIPVAEGSNYCHSESGKSANCSENHLKIIDSRDTAIELVNGKSIAFL